MQKVVLKVGGMTCSACQNRVEKYLNKQEGVNASVNLVMATALINYDEEKVTIADLERFIRESGYKSLGIYDNKEDKKDNSKIYLFIYGILLIFLMYVSMGHMLGLPTLPYLNMLENPINYGVFLLILTCFFLIFGRDIIIKGLKNIKSLSPNMDSLVTIGVLASFFYSIYNLIMIIKGNTMYVEHLYFESVAMIIYFIKLGRIIDDNSKEKTKEAIKDLVRITPTMALLKNEDKMVEVSIDEVKKGDILICKPGMKVAVDGIITKGDAYFDEAFLTGESKPSKKGINSKIMAGAINLDGYIEYEAVNIGPDSTISEIVGLVVEATSGKAPIQRIADKVSSIFAPSIIIIAILTLICYLLLGYDFNLALTSFVTVLVVACPCALGLATPLAMVVSVGTSLKDGILIKKNAILEEVNKIDTVVFDKTGTLTYGKLNVSKIYNYSKYSDDTLLELVASLEHNSTHPISLAFTKYYNPKNEVVDFKNLDGIGIKGKVNNLEIILGNNKILNKSDISKYMTSEEKLTKDGNSIIYVIINNKVSGLIGIKDTIRKEAKEVIKNLENLGKNIIILSGDNKNTALKVAQELNINKIVADVLPQEKQKYLEELKENGHKVMMIGDGINDAPSLALSDIGVSLSSGTDIASNSSDVLLIHNDLKGIINLFKIGKKTLKIIKENLFWAFIYNILMIPVAIGLLRKFNITISPMFASITMTISSLTVVLNSLRLKKIK